MADATARPFAVGPHQGDAYWYLGGLIVYKASSEQTGGWGLSVETYPAGFASALHVHETEDSGFYVLSGRLRVRVGDEDITAGPGGLIFLPKQVPHAFRVEGDELATWINIQGPTGDFRRLVEETGERAPSATLPPWPTATGTPDAESSADARARHRLRMLGPPPFD